jgi:hypothetical protein
VAGHRDEPADERSRRRADAKRVREYHQQQLGLLFEHVREGLVRFDAGELDAFGLDAIIYRYSRSAKELWKFCGYGESRIPWAVHALESSRHSGTEPDWWELGDPDRRRRRDRTDPAEPDD